jgi:hypothetical protein
MLKGKMVSQEVLEQVCENCGENYCTIREFIYHSGNKIYNCSHSKDEHELCFNILFLIKKNVGDRVLLQFKCIEELKWIRSREFGRALSWDEADVG